MWLDEAQWDHPLDDNIAYFTYFILFYFILFLSSSHSTR